MLLAGIMYMLDLPLSLYCLTVTQSAELVAQLVEHWSRNPVVMDLNLISKTAQVFSLLSEMYAFALYWELYASLH